MKRVHNVGFSSYTPNKCANVPPAGERRGLYIIIDRYLKYVGTNWRGRENPRIYGLPIKFGCGLYRMERGALSIGWSVGQSVNRSVGAPPKIPKGKGKKRKKEKKKERKKEKKKEKRKKKNTNKTKNFGCLHTYIPYVPRATYAVTAKPTHIQRMDHD